ncbi:hypothetical protein FOCC_FOCC007629 [Frankliniella occidentalis]|nr:hypothetical protein FOCC_FOCC007629 [Frankliniella occidentalis]
MVLHGVDTVADVYLNGHLLGHTDNMFVRYRFDVKDLLKVHFTSPVLAAAARAARQAEQYVVPPTCPPANYHGECSVNLLRKMQASFAWDWGPAFPSAGLWKGVALEAYDEAVLRDVGFDASPGASGAWEARVRVHWEAGAGARPAAPAATSAVLSVVLAPADGGAPIASKDVPVTLVPDAHGLGHTDVGLSVPRFLSSEIKCHALTELMRKFITADPPPRTTEKIVTEDWKRRLTLPLTISHRDSSRDESMPTFSFPNCINPSKFSNSTGKMNC